jgi:hypothetical protein
MIERFSDGETEAWIVEVGMPAAVAIDIAVESVSPVTMEVEMPMRCRAATAATAVSFTVSWREMVPA